VEPARLNVREALENRRACRSFLGSPLPPGLLDDFVDRARRTPSAGNAQGVEFLVLEGSEQTAAYWEVTLPERNRDVFPWPGLLLAPALVVIYADADRYLERYSEPDKSAAGLGGSDEDWPIPYWFIDAAFAALALQLLVVGEDLGCCFFGLFGRERAVADRFGAPERQRAIGAVAIGYPAPEDQRASASAGRGRRDLDEVLHRGRWSIPDVSPPEDHR